MAIETKSVKIMASMDWSMRAGMRQFLDYLDPVVTWRKKKYKLELGRAIAGPLRAGEDLKPFCDFLVDRTIHWNDWYKYFAQQCINSQMKMANHANTFQTQDKHSTYDLMHRAIHPKDRLPTTVLLPQFRAYTEEQKLQEKWQMEQQLIIANTEYGWDETRRTTNWAKVQESLDRSKHFEKFIDAIHDQFYCKGNYIADTVEKHFHGQFPIYLKKAFGGGGSQVYKVHNLQELYEKYDTTGNRSFHLQEAIEDYDLFVRCMAIGPQILPMRFQPDEPLHKHYSPEKLEMVPQIHERLSNYVMLINAYHRWTYNSFEALVKNDAIHPIDFANACPDSNFTSLHVHFPWLICALVKWISFCAVTDRDMRIDQEQNKYLDVLNNPKISQLKKYQHASKISRDYFENEKFQEFCAKNFPDIEERMIDFYDEHFDGLIAFSIQFSDFPAAEHERFYWEYKNLMDGTFRPNAGLYLTDVIYQ